METGSIISWVLYFVVSVIIAWIVLSIILGWFNPALYNADGTVNWWTTLWVAALVIIFAWLLILLLGWILSLFRGSECPPPIKCETKCNKCDNVCGAVHKQTTVGYNLFY